MQTVNITLNRQDAAASVESLLWKYGSSIEGAENFKLVYNTKSDSNNNAVDSKVIFDSWEKRVREIVGVLRDFGSVTSQSAGEKTVTLSMPNRWNGTPDTLKSLIEQYVCDGMMADWLTATAPGEASMYSNRLADDITLVKLELYAKGAP